MQRISTKEREYVLEALQGEFQGSKSAGFVRRFEEQFAAEFESAFAISFANGTATLHASLAAAGVGPGDEVVVPPLTMASTTLAVLHTGATPIFADVHPETWTLDVNSVRERMTERTRAIIPVSLYGLPSFGEEFMALAEGRNLLVLDDAAQCFQGYQNGRIVGSITHVTSFSLQSSKHLSSGEGGVVTTDSEELALRMRRVSSLGYGALAAQAGGSKIRKQAIQDPGYKRHVSSGWNYRMPEVAAAVALAQTERIDELVQVRVEAARQMEEARGNAAWLVPQSVPAGFQHSYWTYAVALDSEADVTWSEFRKEFAERGGGDFYGAWSLTYLEPFLQNLQGEFSKQRFEAGLCPVAESLQPRLIQFKTNAFEGFGLERQADALHETIQRLGRAGA